MSLVFSGVTKSYGAVVALRNASFEVEKGEIRALLGGNGSGKSTLAKIIGGLVSIDDGRIEYCNQPIIYKSPREAKNKGVVITSQELSLFSNLTVQENINICYVPKKLGLFSDNSAMNKLSQNILKEMGIDHLLLKRIDDLPPNEQYLVEFAKALIQNPNILVIDEITSALYKEDVLIVDRMLKKLKSEGKIVIFISHRMNEIYSICDSVTVMRNGETLSTHSINDKNEIELLSLMTGRDISHRHRVEPQSEEELIKDSHYLVAEEIIIPSYNTSVNLAIRHGEVIGVAGLQGHGQSELVRSLFGLLEPVKMHKEGTEIKISTSIQAVMHGFSFISGDREKEGVFSERNIYENMFSVTELVKRKNVINPDEVIKSLGVKYDNIKQNILALSGGNQQKVVVGRWLSDDVSFIIADDPTKGIDVQARTDLHAAFCKMAEKGCPVIMVSSDDDELVNLTSMSPNSRVIVVYEGQIVRSLRGNEITIENIAAASMPDKEVQ